MKNLTWPARRARTSCAGSLCHYPEGVRERFPLDQGLIDLRVESYLGVPLLDGDGNVLGHLAVFDGRPMPAEPRLLFIFRIFATRAAVELERLRVEKQLVESERRYRDLYEEAPNAYVSLGRDLRLINVNRRAAQLLGCLARTWSVRVSSTYFAKTASRPGQGRASLCRGVRRRGGLRRSSWRCAGATASPLWVSLWMRPMRGVDRWCSGRPLHLGRRHRPRAGRVRAQRGSSEQNTLPSARDQVRPQLRGDRRPQPALTAVLDKVRRVAATDATVLIQGETGTGKELIARAIHSTSRRRDKPLIKINCAALPAGLVESELFGHEKGAFTGAIARRTGRFELADGGTIFLDEIGELPRRDPGQAASRPAGARVRPGRRRRRPRKSMSGSSPPPTATCSKAVARKDVPRRPVLPPQRLPGPTAAAARAARGHPAPGAVLLDKFAARIARRFDGIEPATLRRLDGVPVAGQRPRAGERHRARRHPRDRSHARDRSRRPRPTPSAERRQRSVCRPRRRRAQPYPRGPRANKVGH